MKKANLTQNALAILKKRYLKKGETPEDMFWRVAENIANADKLYGISDEDIHTTAHQFYDMMVSLDFLPNSPCLRGAGRELQQCVACFVIPVEDDLESIFDAIKTAALIHKTGGGTGYSFSRLRPKGDIVKSTGNNAGGPVSFMKVFAEASREITQGGVRLGANMGILRVDHPDILEFIHCKDDGVSLTNFNISVAVTDDFMASVAANSTYALINPRTQKIVERLDAKKVFDEIAQSAWKTGDPGIIFIDTVNKFNPTPNEKIEATNPCGEQPLLPYESCVLGSINLAHMVKDRKIDYARLGEVVDFAVHFLDNVIDVNRYPTEQIENRTKQNRKIGLGVMGWADMLVQLGISYNSEQALLEASNVMKCINQIAYDASLDIGDKKGHFPNIKNSNDVSENIRNAARTTIAPTGTISIIAGCNGGIEPFFALAYQQSTLFDAQGATKTLTIVNPAFESVAKKRGFYSQQLMEQIAQFGSIQHLNDIPDDIKELFVVSHDITPQQHIKMQAAFQEYTDNAISKTINMSNDATVQDVKDAYMLAWELGCKGITIYRDGCRTVQVMNVKKDENEIKHRETELQGITYRSDTPLGKAYVTINYNGHKEPFEVFINIGKAGSDTTAFAEAIGRLISLLLRLPSKLSQTKRLEEIAYQLLGIGGTSSVGFGEKRVRSLPDAIGQILNKHLGNKSAIKGYDLCPECGHSLQWQEGCYKCLNCGYSRC